MAQSWWQWLRGWWNIGTIGGFSRLYDTISKIRARHGTRLFGLYATSAADSLVSPRRERQVVRQNPTLVNRPGPVQLYSLHGSTSVNAASPLLK